MDRLSTLNVNLLRSDVLMLTAAIIWGFAFVAQRAGMEHVGPFYFTAIRFSLGLSLLVPFLFISGRRRTILQQLTPTHMRTAAAVGLALFAGVSLQQLGLVYTSAGNAGFITGLYVVFVPFLSVLLGRPLRMISWLSSLLALVGLYQLSAGASAEVAFGDLLVLGCAVIWAVHIMLIDYATRDTDPMLVACTQFAMCAVLSFAVAVVAEDISWKAIRAATVPLAYGGFMSVGLGYTLQVIAQRDAEPSHAAILLSSEALFALFGGWLLLRESISTRGSVGCAIMFAAILISQCSTDRR